MCWRQPNPLLCPCCHKPVTFVIGEWDEKEGILIHKDVDSEENEPKEKKRGWWKKQRTEEEIEREIE